MKAPFIFVVDYLYKLLYHFVGSCPSSVRANLPNLPHGVSCSLLSDCTQIDCCVYIPTLHMSFQLGIKLDTCRLKIELDIETFHSEIVVSDYEFGTYTQFSLQGFLNLE